MAFVGGAIRDALYDAIRVLNEDEQYVLLKVANKLRGKGRDEYGPLDLATDRRNLARETMDEVADALAYAAMKLAKGLK